MSTATAIAETADTTACRQQPASPSAPSPRIQSLFDEHEDLRQKYTQSFRKSVEYALLMPKAAYRISREGTEEEIALFRKKYRFLWNDGTFSQYCTVGSHTDDLLALEVTVNRQSVRVRDYLPPYWTTAYELRGLNDDQFADLIRSGTLHPEAPRSSLRDVCQRYRATAPYPSPAAAMGHRRRHDTCSLRISIPARLPEHRRKEIEALFRKHFQPLGYTMKNIAPDRTSEPKWTTTVRTEVDRLSGTHLDDGGWLSAVAELMLAELMADMPPATAEHPTPTILSSDEKRKYLPTVSKQAAKAILRFIGYRPNPATAASVPTFEGRIDEGLYVAVTTVAVRRLIAADERDHASTAPSLLRYAVSSGISEEIIADEVQFIHEWAHQELRATR